MTRQVSHELTEAASRPSPGRAAAQVGAETLARPSSAGAEAAGVTGETVASSQQPPVHAVAVHVEAASMPQPVRSAVAFLVEVLRRDTAAADIRTSAIDAYGQAPGPQAQRAVFAFRHDWASPLVERLEWSSSVVRTASGGELRSARRFAPRRVMRYSVGHGRAHDALAADWIADHLGTVTWWPLPQYTVALEAAAPAGAMAIQAAGIPDAAFVPAQYQPQLDGSGLFWNAGDGQRRALAVDGEHWQVLALADVEDSRFWLAEPLARRLRTGSLIMPLVQGVADAGGEMALWRPGVAGGTVTARVTFDAPPLPEDMPADPILEALPVWPDANWRDDPGATGSGELTLIDRSPADPWVRRDDPWPTTTLQRRYLACGREQITHWRARLYRMQGRVGECWVPDGLAPVLRVNAAAGVDDGYLRVSGAGAQAYWHRPAGAVILHPDGSRQHVLTGVYHHDQGSVLVLRSGLAQPVPAGSRIVRLARCRLDHDAVDFNWHTTAVVEIALTLRVLPPQRGMTYEDDYGGGGGGDPPVEY